MSLTRRLITLGGMSLFLLLAVCHCWAAYPLLPQPVEQLPGPGSFQLARSAPILIAGDSAELREVGEVGEYLAKSLRQITSTDSPVRRAADSSPVRNSVLLALEPGDAALGEEGYELQVSPEGIVIRAPKPAGVFYGVQTLLQMLDAPSAGVEPGRVNAQMTAWEIPCVAIRDHPRFKWRGLMLDCSRTFQSPDYLRKTIDRMAAYKMNVLHLHLTDDQGWRLEIKKYPELTKKGARFPQKYNEPESTQGFYTQREMRDLVEYARKRFVTIVPEIELPGHSLAALSCYPELSCTGGPFEIFPFFKGPGVTQEVFCAGNEETFRFFEDVFAEVADIFPSTFVHVGGDEVPKDRWKACPKCQQRMREEGLKNEQELQSYFIRRAESILKKHGRRLIGWDEILEGGLAPEATVMSWRGTAGGIAAARAGHDVVMSPTSHCYFDYDYKAINSKRAYEFEPVPAELSPEEGRHILGLQANFWSHIDRVPDKVDHQLFPRLLALAERAWSPADRRDWEGFRGRLKEHLPKLTRWGVHYNPQDLGTGTEGPTR